MWLCLQVVFALPTYLRLLACVDICACVCVSAWSINLKSGFPYIFNLLLYFIFFLSLGRFATDSSCGPRSEQYVLLPAASVAG